MGCRATPGGRLQTASHVRSGRQVEIPDLAGRRGPIWVQFGDSDDPDRSSPNRVVVTRIDLFTWQIEATTQVARVLREGKRVRGWTQRDTLGFVPLPFRATLRAQQ